MSSANVSSDESLVVVRHPSALPPAFTPPAYLQVSTHRVLLCTRCGSGYVRKNYERHLRDTHHLKRKLKKCILEWLATEDIAEEESEVLLPPFEQPPIPGLPVLDGYACNSVVCTYVTTSGQLIGRHCRIEHGRKFVDDNVVATRVSLQTLFAKNPKYFRVTPSNKNQPTRASPLAHTLLSATDARNALDDRYYLAQSSSQLRQNRSHQPLHISEITPWLRVTNFHAHKQVFGDVEDFSDVLCLPSRDSDLSLSLVCESVDRLLRRGLDRVRNDRVGKRLHRLDAQHLNSFQAGVISQDRFERLDREHSIQSYISTFQQLICYFFRVENDHFGSVIFKVTDRQRQTSVDVLEEAMSQVGALEEVEHRIELAAAHGVRANEDGIVTDDDIIDEDTTDEEIRGNRRMQRRRARASNREFAARQDEQRLDKVTLAFCLSLIQHELDDSSFDSAMLSFCAVLAWNSSKKAWRKDVGNYSSYLSQLIYVSQLFILLHCDELHVDGQYSTLNKAIIAQRDLWLQNTSRGPVGDMQAWRLYARSVAGDTVGIAQIRWHQDGLTLAYRDITYKVSYLHDEMKYCLDEARRILTQDLAFDLPNIPVFTVEDLVDNWDSVEAQKSFIDDPRNADCLDGGQDWLYQQVRSSATLAPTALQEDVNGRWVVRPDFAQQYEMAVQHFLEVMLTVLHKGSGQPARRPEMLGLRWQNTAYDKRNLFIHDGYVLFILTYHKSQSQTHASRYPVRFLLPEAGELLVQYLVLVQSFRRWLSQDTQTPERVTEYLWSGSNSVWSDDRMTRLIQRNSLLSVGVSTHIQAWRQIAVGIAIKLFSGTGYQADLDRPGDPDDDNEGRPFNTNTGDMPEVFHYQATHAPRTGNQVYGGTVNFKDGLTDAGLQQYLQASQMWHRLCYAPPQPTEQRRDLPSTTQSPLGRFTSDQSFTMSSPIPWPSSPPTASRSSKHRPKPSLTQEAPLQKRLALRRTPQRHRRRWNVDDAMTVLRSFFGRDAAYRSSAQSQMIEEILSGRGEVVAALATSEGKSLAFLLPCRLPGAGTTVVILPLVVLKQDMFRRCTELGLQFAIWDRQGDLAQYSSCPLIFVSAEAAVLSPFRTFLTGLDAREGLDRVVFDESHLVLTASDYRPKLKLIKSLRTLRCQFVFLSATLPPLLMPTFSQRLLLWNPSVVRSEHTFRHDLQYAVAFTRHDPKATFVQQAIQGIQTTLALPMLRDDPTARVIVYTLTREVAKEIATALDVDTYYSDSGTIDEKAAVLTRWMEGSRRAVVATSAFGMGVDYPRVAAVLHVGAPTNAINFAQEIGRLGRDGRGGQSTVILPPEFVTTESSPDIEVLQPLEQQVMNSYVRLPRCHASVLSWFLDDQPWYCDSEEVDRRCSRCRRLGRWSDEAEAEQIPRWLGAKQRRRMAIEDGRPIPSDAESTDTLNGDELFIPEMVRQHVRDEAHNRERYIRRLEQFNGSCLICQLLGSTGLGEDRAWHDLDKCRHQRKGDFFKAKKAEVEEAKREKKRWLAKFAACFGCGNPQEVCQEQGVKGCRFRDVVFPASWAFYHMDKPFGKTLEEWTGRDFSNESGWMKWLGQEREVYGMRATNAMWVTDQVLGELGGIQVAVG